MKRQWDIEELIEHFTLVEDDLKILTNKTGATRLGCAILLKCFQLEGRFPQAKYEIPRSVMDYLARQLKLDAALFQQYDWEGRTIKLHRAQIREELGSAKLRLLIAMPSLPGSSTRTCRGISRSITSKPRYSLSFVNARSSLLQLIVSSA